MTPPRAPLAALLAAGCTCGDFEAYLPVDDTHYVGHETCGPVEGATGHIDGAVTDAFTMTIVPNVGVFGTSQENIDVVAITMEVTMSRAEMQALGEVAFTPWATVPSDAEVGYSELAFTEGTIEVLEYVEAEGVPAQETYRIAWELTFGERDADDTAWLWYSGEDRVAAFL